MNKKLCGIIVVMVMLFGCVGCDCTYDLDQPLQDVFNFELHTWTPNLITPVVPEQPTVNVPIGNRESNWGGGSCVHASVVMLFRWQGRPAMAQHWRETYTGGEFARGLHSKMDREGVRYAYTINADVKFIEWALKTHRGAAVTCMGGVHMVCLVHLDDKRAGILDNNFINKIKWMPRKQFLAEWRASDGWATTVLYTPSAPLPQ